MGTVTPLRPPSRASRTADTARPKSGTRMRASPTIPPPAPAPVISLVERLVESRFPCEAVECRNAARFSTCGLFEGIEVVSFLCAGCIGRLPAHVRVVALPKELG
jgi:hypothetical protein